MRISGAEATFALVEPERKSRLETENRLPGQNRGFDSAKVFGRL